MKHDNTPIRPRRRRQPKVLLAIDTQNMCHPNIRINYARLREFCQTQGELVASIAFVTDSPETLNFQLWLHHNGYTVEPIRPRSNGHGQLKGNADIAMAFWLGTAIERYRLKRGDILVLCSGDADFVPIIERLRARGIVTLLFAYRASAAPQLQVISDRFYPLEDIPEFYREREAAA